MPSPAITATEMCTTLGGTRVLNNVNLTIDPATFVAVVGPNGAGKTTLLRSLIGTVPTTGTIDIHGTRGPSRARLIGYVPQASHFAADYPLDVASVVVTGLIRAGRLKPFATRADWRRVAEALDIVGMSHVSQRSFSALSGGQRQRVLLARALVSGPKVLFLDEPGTGLDLPAQAQLFSTIKQLAASGVTVVMSTHDLGEAVDTCDELVLVKGTVVAHTTTINPPPARVWMDTFGVPADSHLLRTVGIRDEKDVICP